MTYYKWRLRRVFIRFSRRIALIKIITGIKVTIPLTINEIAKFSGLLPYMSPVTELPKMTPISKNINNVPTAFPFKPGKDKSTAHANNEGESNPKPTPNNTDETL